MFFVDDEISGMSFDHSDFQRMQMMAEAGKIDTIIVKDLSRFGREQVEAGRLTQIIYPSLGITFISIQENVNSTTGVGMEMLPFYRMVCSSNLKENSCSMGFQSRKRQACLSHSSVWVYERSK